VTGVEEDGIVRFRWPPTEQALWIIESLSASF